MSDIQKFRKSMNGFNRHDVVTYIEYLNNKHNAQTIQLNNQLQAALAQPKLDPILLNQLQGENDQLREQVKLVQAENDQLREQAKLLQAENESLKNAVHIAPASVVNTELEAENAALKREVATLQTQVSVLQTECDARAAMPAVTADDGEKRILALKNDYELRLTLMKKDYEAQISALQAELSARPAQAGIITSYTEQELEAYRRAERVERLAKERARQTRQHANSIINDASAKVQAAANQLAAAATNIASQLDIYKSAVMEASVVLTGTASALDDISPEE